MERGGGGQSSATFNCYRPPLPTACNLQLASINVHLIITCHEIVNDDDGDEDDDAGFWVTLTHFTELGLEIDFHANKET